MTFRHWVPGAARRAGAALACAAMLATVLAPTAGEAQARPDTRRMSCAQALDLVNRSGSIVLTTGRFTYDRFVASARYCDRDEETAIKRVPTLDSPRCPLKFCRPASIDRDPPLIFR